jgi:hypothetical protein
MNVTTDVPSAAEPSADRAGERALLLGLGLSSFAALLLELALTRLFSVVLFYHFAFLAISIALLGLGAGGVYAYLHKGRLARLQTRALIARLGSINALVVAVVLVVVLRIPVSLRLSAGNLLRLTGIYLVSAVPFFLTGLQFSVVFARTPRHIPRLYGADLLGGAMACLAVVPLLNFLGGPNTVLFAGVMMGIAAAIWAPGGKPRHAAGLGAGLLLALIAANYSGRLIDVVYAKGIFRNRSWVEFARWNAISRVEVDQQGDAKAVVIDADASTYLMNADPKQWQDPAWREDFLSPVPSLASLLRPQGKFAVIGPGGGVDVLRALVNGSPSVTGIEINPIIADTIMRGRYADYTYHLYERPDVHIHVTDGRSFLRSTEQRFDVVQMTLVDTWASTAAGAFALSENSLYTVEAFQEYFAHLNPDGLIAVTRWEFREPREALRVVSVAMEALHRMGVSDTSGHFIVVAGSELDEDGIPVVVLAKNSSFTTQEINTVREFLSANDEHVPLYLPAEPADNPFSSLIKRNDPAAFAAQYAYNVAPVNDNSPFFFFTLKLDRILHPKGLTEGIDWKVNLGVVVLGIVLVISLLVVVAFLIIPLAVRAGRQQQPIRLLYFIAIGLGYILVEIAFIQRFVLFLGHPTYALTVVVFLLLLSSGAGSLASRKWMGQTARGWLPLGFIATALLLYVFLLPPILHALVGLPFLAKLLVSGVVLVPLGFAMGMPFPTGLRALASQPAPEFPALATGEANENAVEWAWAMNASSSVLGSVLAIVIAIQFGLNITLACGAAAYLLAWGLSGTLKPRPA